MPQIRLHGLPQTQAIIVPLTPEQAVEARARLTARAKSEDWPAARLRAKRGWVSRRTVGWRPRCEGRRGDQ